jgi:hypothetical protein
MPRHTLTHSLRIYNRKRAVVFVAEVKGFNTEGTEESGGHGGVVNARASWGAALRTGTAGSKDESRCSAIHKQRRYLRRRKERARHAVPLRTSVGGAPYTSHKRGVRQRRRGNRLPFA